MTCTSASVITRSVYNRRSWDTDTTHGIHQSLVSQALLLLTSTRDTRCESGNHISQSMERSFCQFIAEQDLIARYWLQNSLLQAAKRLTIHVFWDVTACLWASSTLILKTKKPSFLENFTMKITKSKPSKPTQRHGATSQHMCICSNSTVKFVASPQLFP